MVGHRLPRQSGNVTLGKDVGCLETERKKEGESKKAEGKKKVWGQCPGAGRSPRCCCHNPAFVGVPLKIGRVASILSFLSRHAFSIGICHRYQLELKVLLIGFS